MRGFIFHEDNLNNVYVEMGEQMDRIHSFILTNVRVRRTNIPMQPKKGCLLDDYVFDDNIESVMRSQIMADIFESAYENIKEIQVQQVLYSAQSVSVGNVQVKFTIPESREVLNQNLVVKLD